MSFSERRHGDARGDPQPQQAHHGAAAEEPGRRAPALQDQQARRDALPARPGARQEPHRAAPGRP